MSERRMVPYKTRSYFPADHKLVVKLDAKKKETSGGLAIPDSAQDKQTYVTVVAVAENLKDKFKVGDRLCYGGFYQMVINHGQDDGIVVLRYPEEVMYKFEDKEGMRMETDDEYAVRAEEEAAKERLSAGRNGKLVLTDAT